MNIRLPLARFGRRCLLLTLLLLVTALRLSAADRYLTVEYPASADPDELQFGVTYTLWVPDGVKQIRGIIVHQHGCGSGACKGGETAAYDLHWQALARKWDCALLGPSYHQEDKQNCRLWCDPRNGSYKTFLRALDDFAAQAKHPEIAKVPWCLWGHSGGGYWASLMQTMYPHRIIATWLRSGTAYSTWEKGETLAPVISDAVYQIPTMCNPGAKENGDKRFNAGWAGSVEMFQAYRAKGALIGFAPDPRTSHETGDQRYLAIPFFDACLAQRLPPKGSHGNFLLPMDARTAWLGKFLGHEAQPAVAYQGDASQAVWLPDANVAKAWGEYVQTGATSDTTPPPAPTDVKVSTVSNNAVEITWSATADFESGLAFFIIRRDGQDVGQVPKKLVGKFGRALFQTMSYHDTPEKPLPEMKYVDTTLKPGEKHQYQVIAVNTVGLLSTPAPTLGAR